MDTCSDALDHVEAHQGILSLLALQAPVASDLRIVAALLHVIKRAERMGDQCVNIAKLLPLTGHEPPVDEHILGIAFTLATALLARGWRLKPCNANASSAPGADDVRRHVLIAKVAARPIADMARSR